MRLNKTRGRYQLETGLICNDPKQQRSSEISLFANM